MDEDTPLETYIRNHFSPFVTKQVETMWRPENFERIRQVLTADHYYRNTESQLSNRPKTHSTRQYLLWLSERSRQKQTKQPLLTPSQKFPSTRGPKPLPLAAASNEAKCGLRKENPPIRGREIMGQVSGLIQDMSLDWRMKHAIAKRFCRYLLRKKILKPFKEEPGKKYSDNELLFDDYKYYVWNRNSSATQSVPISETKVATVQLEKVAMSQMRELIKSQKELISNLKQQISRNTCNSESEQRLLSFHSFKQDGLYPRFSTKFPMRPSTTIGISSDPEIYYDVNLSFSDRYSSDRNSKYPPRVSINSIEPRKSIIRPSTVPAMIKHDSPKTLAVVENPESGFLFQIKKNLTFGQQSLVSTALGLKSYLFKGTATTSNDISVISVNDEEQEQNSKRARKSTNRGKRQRDPKEIVINRVMVSDFATFGRNENVREQLPESEDEYVTSEEEIEMSLSGNVDMTGLINRKNTPKKNKLVTKKQKRKIIRSKMNAENVSVDKMDKYETYEKVDELSDHLKNLSGDEIDQPADESSSDSEQDVMSVKLVTVNEYEKFGHDTNDGSELDKSAFVIDVENVVETLVENDENGTVENEAIIEDKHIVENETSFESEPTVENKPIVEDQTTIEKKPFTVENETIVENKTIEGNKTITVENKTTLENETIIENKTITVENKTTLENETMVENKPIDGHNTIIENKTSHENEPLIENEPINETQTIVENKTSIENEMIVKNHTVEIDTVVENEETSPNTPHSILLEKEPNVF